MKITIDNGSGGTITVEEFLEPTGAFYRLSSGKDGEECVIDFDNTYTIKELIASLKFITSDREVIL